MKLIKPSLKYKESYLEALDEFNNNNITGFWHLFEDFRNIEKYLAQCELYSQGERLPKLLVPASTFWFIDNNEFIGHTNIRHELNGYLEKTGGHIGYHIRPSQWKKGYGTKILELALNESIKLGLKEVLITANEVNIASWKIIEKNGGVLVNTIEVKGEDSPIRRYRVNISK
jgi:predicted acetyltransferase